MILTCRAILPNHSLFALGGLIWLFKRLKFSAKSFASAGGLLLLLAAAALVVGEQVAKRFPDLLTNGAGFRTKIYHDSFRLIGTTPLEGVGMVISRPSSPLFASSP